MSIVKLILGALLRFFWERAESWYQQELLYQKNKRLILNEVKDVARKAAEENSRIAIDRESVDDSFLRLERVILRREVSVGRPIFGDAYRGGPDRDSAGYQGVAPAVSVSESGSPEEAAGIERSGSESMGAGSDDSVPST